MIDNNKRYNIEKSYFYSGKIVKEFNPYNEFNIYKKIHKNLLNIDIDACIIGESHFVYIKDLDYMEILVNTDFYKKMLKFNTKDDINIQITPDHYYKIIVEIISGKLNMQHIKNEYENIFEFDKDSLTGINIEDSNGILQIKTIHSYKEYDKMLKTKTSIYVES